MRVCVRAKRCEGGQCLSKRFLLARIDGQAEMGRPLFSLWLCISPADRAFFSLAL